MPLLLLTLSLSGCGMGESQLEASLEQELVAVIGPADRYDVDVSGLYPVVSGLSVAGGTAERITAVGHNVRPEGAPALERVDVVVSDVVYDGGTKSVTSVGDASMKIRVDEQAAREFLEARPELENVVLALVPPDRVRIQSVVRSGDLKLPGAITVDGKFRAEGAQLLLDIQEVSGAGLLLGGFLTDLISSALNPIIDLSESPYEIVFVEPRVDAQALVVGATGSYP